MRASRLRTQVRVRFQGEARFGQQGTLTAVWAVEGSRPTVVRQNGRKSIWAFAVVEPATGWSSALPFRDVNAATPCRRSLTGQRASFAAASTPS